MLLFVMHQKEEEEEKFEYGTEVNVCVCAGIESAFLSLTVIMKGREEKTPQMLIFLLCLYLLHLFYFLLFDLHIARSEYYTTSIFSS